MDDIAIARALHILAVVHWIGGVALVTLVILPAVTRLAQSAHRLPLFETIERRFSFQARTSVTLAGISGFYMAHRLGAWDRFLDVGFWWMHAMVLVWAIFTVILFIAEPLFLHAWFEKRARHDPESTFRLVLKAHRIMLTLSLVTVGAAVLGAHGMFY